MLDITEELTQDAIEMASVSNKPFSFVYTSGDINILPSLRDIFGGKENKLKLTEINIHEISKYLENNLIPTY